MDNLNNTNDIELIKRNRLKSLINEKGTTQKRIADDCGYTPQYLSYLLSGARPIVKDNAVVLAKVLDVDPEYLLGETDYRTRLEYYRKSTEYHSSVEAIFLELLNLLDIKISWEEYFVEKSETIKNLEFSEISHKTDRSQAIKVVTPRVEKIITETEFQSKKDIIVNAIIDIMEE